eukprot:2628648-Prymnesium_polylepis.1
MHCPTMQLHRQTSQRARRTAVRLIMESGERRSHCTYMSPQLAAAFHRLPPPSTAFHRLPPPGQARA